MVTRSGNRASVLDALAAAYQKHDAFYRRVAKSWGKRAAVLMTSSKRARDFNEMRQWQSQSQAQAQSEMVAPTIEPDEIHQQAVPQPAQTPVEETVKPAIKPSLILPEVPKKQSRGIRM